MPTPGQPTSYKPEYCELAHNYCLLGATNEALGGFFGVIWSVDAQRHQNVACLRVAAA
jgi:hypothetical protein